MTSLSATTSEHAVPHAPSLPESRLRFGAPLFDVGIARGTDTLRQALASSTWGARAAALISAMTVFRLFIIATSGLSDTEAYYYVWSKFPAWSYYDHPPMVAWMTGLTTAVLDSHSPFAIRVGSVAASTAFGALLYWLGAKMFSPRAGFIAVVVVTLLPAYLFTSFLANPEAPLAPLWVLFLLLLDGLRDHDEPWRPLALGAVIGVAFLAKFTALLAVPLVLIVVAASPSMRSWLKRPAFYGAGLVALVGAAPVVIWNYQHHWPSISLHLVERMPPLTFVTLVANLRRTVIGQTLLFHPLAFPGLIAMLVVAGRRALTDERYRLLFLTSAPLLLFFYIAMTKAFDAEPHWTMVGYIPLAIVVGAWLDERADSLSRIATGYLASTVAVSIALAVAYLVHTRTTVILEAIPASAYNANVDPINETLAWGEVTTAIRDQAARLGPDAVVVGSHNVLCGRIAAEIDDTPAVYCASPRKTAFDFFDRRDAPPGVPVLYVESTRYREDIARALPMRSCVSVDAIDVSRGGRKLNEYDLYACSPIASPLEWPAARGAPVASRDSF